MRKNIHVVPFTQEIISRKFIIVPDLNHQNWCCAEFCLIKAPEMFLYKYMCALMKFLFNINNSDNTVYNI